MEICWVIEDMKLADGQVSPHCVLGNDHHTTQS
jgi:hypothetical protein